MPFSGCQLFVRGVNPTWTFRVAAIRYLNEKEKRTRREDARQLEMLDAYIGDLPIDAVHIGSLRQFMEDRKTQGVKNRTINSALQVVWHILNLASGEWLDEQGRPWLEHVPKIKLLPQKDSRKPYPLSWEEQELLFKELPPYLLKMALFAVNIGTITRHYSEAQLSNLIEASNLVCLNNSRKTHAPTFFKRELRVVSSR